MALLLQRVSLGVGGTEHLKLTSLNLDRLSLAHRLDQHTVDLNRRSCGDGLELLIGKLRHVEDYLHVLDCRTVVQRHKLNMLVASAGAHPTHDTHFLTYQFGSKQVNYLCTFHCKLYYI